MSEPQSDPRVESLTDRYSGEARAYEALWAPVLNGPARRLVELLGGAGARTVVDIGAGVGTFLPLLRTAYAEAAVIGTDRSEGMLARVPDGNACAVMDASCLAIASNTVDVATLVFMLFHLPDPLTGLREARRVLRPGGRAGTVTWGDDFESAATVLWNDELDAFGANPLDSENHLAQHELVDTPAKMESLMQEAGFVSVRATAATDEARIGVEHLIGLRTSMGRHRVRFDSLDSDTQAAFLASVKAKLSALPDGAFVCRGVFVYCVGEKA